jgi:hypothetical protein
MRILPVILLTVLVACGDSTTEPTNASVAGMWSLQTINGSPLPFVFSQTATTNSEVSSDVLKVTSDGKFTQTTTTRTTQNGIVSTDRSVHFQQLIR